MLTGPAFATMLREHGFAFATGVPCSLIEDLIRTLDEGAQLSYVPAVREDVAVGLAAGAWLAGQRPVVLMQNSGLGTSMNALADPAEQAIGLDLGHGSNLPQPSVSVQDQRRPDDRRRLRAKDAGPERRHGGPGISCSPDLRVGESTLWPHQQMNPRHQRREALGQRSGHLFVEQHDEAAHGNQGFSQSIELPDVPAPRTHELGTPSISRFAAIRAAVKPLGSEPVIHANGYPSRESHAIADRPQNFYMIGSMGLASAIGLGVALIARRHVPGAARGVVADRRLVEIAVLREAEASSYPSRANEEIEPLAMAAPQQFQ